MLSASVGIGSRKNICHKTQTAGQAFTACPAAFSARIESVFLVYSGSTVEPLPMSYSSSSSDHKEIPLALFNSTSAKVVGIII